MNRIRYWLSFPARAWQMLCAINERTTKMAVDFTNFDAALSSVGDEMKVISTDVQKVLDKLAAPDTDAQAKVDAATVALQGIKASADDIAAKAEAAVA